MLPKRKPPVRLPGPRAKRIPTTISRVGNSLTSRVAGSYLNLPVIDPPIRQSALGDLVRCPRMALYRYWYGLVPKGRKRAADIGTMFHKLMEYAYQGRDWDLSTQMLSSWMEKQRGELIDWGKEEGRLMDAERMCHQLEQDSQLASVMAYLYKERHPIDTNRYEVRHTEYSFRVPIPVLGGAEVTGTVDLLLWDKQEQAYVIEDYKTTSKKITLWKDAVGFKFQPRIYRIGVQLALNSGLVPGCESAPVSRFIHNVVYRPGIKRKAWQTQDDYLAEIIDFYDRKVATSTRSDSKGKQVIMWDHSDPAPWGEGPPMDRFSIRFAGELIPTAIQHILQHFVNAKRTPPTLDNFPQLGSLHDLCNNMFGASCAYLSLCATPPTLWSEKLPMYRVEQPAVVGDPELLE